MNHFLVGILLYFGAGSTLLLVRKVDFEAHVAGGKSFWVPVGAQSGYMILHVLLWPAFAICLALRLIGRSMWREAQESAEDWWKSTYPSASEETRTQGPHA